MGIRSCTFRTPIPNNATSPLRCEYHLELSKTSGKGRKRRKLVKEEVLTTSGLVNEDTDMDQSMTVDGFRWHAAFDQSERYLIFIVHPLSMNILYSWISLLASSGESTLYTDLT